MKVLVYPHDLGMGGSQTNAIELAAELRGLGVECAVFGRPGTLNARIDELGLRFVESVDPGRRPSPAVVRQVRELVETEGFDIVHGYEWPPTLEGVLALRGDPGKAVVSTVMSMAVAPFIPPWVPLVVGTQQIAATEKAAGRPRVDLLEPPVDLRHNVAPDPVTLTAFRRQWGLDGRPLVVCVTRLAAQLKLEGLLTAIDLAGTQREFQLLVVGDGPSRAEVTEAAQRANAAAGAGTVVLTGELLDPRSAYAVADIVLGMGGSALRALAFAKPLVVQGERGFFEPLSPDTLPMFGWQGWYGVGDGSGSGPARLLAALAPLLHDPGLREKRGGFGREVVERCSLTSAAARQLTIYDDALAASYSPTERALGSTAATGQFLAYHVRRRWSRWRGRGSSDDFNAVPVAARRSAGPRHRLPDAMADGGTIVYFPGVPWHAVQGTDHRLASELATHHPVLWVDPPQSAWASLRHRTRQTPVSEVAPGITRLSVTVAPGVTRPVVREVAAVQVARAARARLRETGASPLAWICSATEPLLAAIGEGPAPRIYLATDDFVAAAPLWRMSPSYLHAARERNLTHADLVLAVTQELADTLRRGEQLPVVFPNGCDLHRFDGISTVEPAKDVALPSPIAGVVGQFNDRTDLEMLSAVQRAGISLLLVGPRSFSSPEADAAFARFVQGVGVQWVDRVPSERVPGYLRCLSVGLTPYADSTFNRRSFPLKTLEYLAAGIPVVCTDVAPVTGFDRRFVHVAATPAQFADATRDALAPVDREDVRRTVETFDWSRRADELLELIEAWRS
ncbi:MAG: glycosyltransferase [Propionibacteriaceae bacterium]